MLRSPLLTPHSRLGFESQSFSVGESAHGYMLKQLSLQGHDVTVLLCYSVARNDLTVACQFEVYEVFTQRRQTTRPLGIVRETRQ